jgi:hypothetical protein
MLTKSGELDPEGLLFKLAKYSPDGMPVWRAATK